MCEQDEPDEGQDGFAETNSALDDLESVDEVLNLSALD